MRGFAGRWAADELRAVALRRYLLQPVAVELFFFCGVSVLLAFHDPQTARAAARAIPVPSRHGYYGIKSAVWATIASPVELVRRATNTQRWCAGEMSNFDYLMFLNTAAGRTFNDLGQYFIMPWVRSIREIVIEGEMTGGIWDKPARPIADLCSLAAACSTHVPLRPHPPYGKSLPAAPI